MKSSVITWRLLDKLSRSIKAETILPVAFEIQEDGKFLLVAIEGPIDHVLGERLAALVDASVPGRYEGDVWMVVFTLHGQVVDSYCGGALAHG